MLEQKVERSAETVNIVAREAQISEKITCEQRPEGNEDMSPENKQGRSFPGGVNSMCKGQKGGACLRW